MPDFEYRIAQGFVQFLPNTPAAVESWAQMAQQSDNTGKFLVQHLPGIKAQLKAAGYTVQKAKKSAAVSDADLLAALGI